MAKTKSGVKNPELIIPNPERTLETEQFPTLYKRTSTGKVEMWQIYTNANIITTKFGQVDGKVQVTNDIVHEGKNIGKINQTSPVQQAQIEAKALWIKKKKKGYVESLEDAKAGKVDTDVIKGGISPMLAHKYLDHAKKIKYPCYGQPKLDGQRCIAIIKDGLCTLWTRTLKPINSMPHIVEDLERQFNNAKDLIFDGELYSDTLNENFEKLVSLTRPDEAVEGHNEVEYHIYDLINDKTQEERATALRNFLSKRGPWGGIRLVDTFELNNEDEAFEKFHELKILGYEGLMLRNKLGKYKNSRSYDLQKIKEALGQKAPLEEEFPIIGVKPGRGKMADKAIFICDTLKGGTFDVKMEGPLDNLIKYLKDKSLWEGMVLTVKFQNWTKLNKPRFCVGVRIRPKDLTY